MPFGYCRRECSKGKRNVVGWGKVADASGWDDHGRVGDYAKPRQVIKGSGSELVERFLIWSGKNLIHSSLRKKRERIIWLTYLRCPRGETGSTQLSIKGLKWYSLTSVFPTNSWLLFSLLGIIPQNDSFWEAGKMVWQPPTHVLPIKQHHGNGSSSGKVKREL